MFSLSPYAKQASKIFIALYFVCIFHENISPLPPRLAQEKLSPSSQALI